MILGIYLLLSLGIGIMFYEQTILVVWDHTKGEKSKKASKRFACSSVALIDLKILCMEGGGYMAISLFDIHSNSIMIPCKVRESKTQP